MQRHMFYLYPLVSRVWWGVFKKISFSQMVPLPIAIFNFEGEVQESNLRPLPVLVLRLSAALSSLKAVAGYDSRFAIYKHITITLLAYYFLKKYIFHPVGIWSVILLKSVTAIQLSIFIFSLACLKPGYSINQSGVVHKVLSWFIFSKKVSVCDLFLIYAKVSYRFGQ